MWKQEDFRDAYASGNGGRTESWWTSKPSGPGEPVDGMLSECLQSTKEGSEQQQYERHLRGKATPEDIEHPQTHPHYPVVPSFRATPTRFDVSSQGSPPLFAHQVVPGIEISTMHGGHQTSWPRQVEVETSGPPNHDFDYGSDLTSRNEVAREVGGDEYAAGAGTLDTATRSHVEDVQEGGVGSSNSVSGSSGSAINAPSKHYSSERTTTTKEDGALEGTLSSLDSASACSTTLPNTDQLTGCPQSLSGPLVQLQAPSESPHKSTSSSLGAVDISSSSSVVSQSQPHITSQTQPQPALPHGHGVSQSLSRLNPCYSSSTSITQPNNKRPFSAVQQYRHLDERQAKRPPLWRRRVNYKSTLTEKEEMLATASPHAYDISNSNMNEQLRYQAAAAHHEASYFSHREPSGTDHGDLFPLSPPLSSARSSFLCPTTNNVAPHTLNGNYNLSTESLPSHVDANTINLLSRPHSMPQLQEQMENPYNSHARNYLHHSPSTEYLSPENSFDDGTMMKPHKPLSAYPSFNAPCPISESLELENNEDSNPSSAQGSSPQAWCQWDPNANIDLVQDASGLIYPAATSAPSALAAGAFHPLPNMSPKRRFNQTPSSENLHNQLFLLQQQQQQQQTAPAAVAAAPRSPMLDQDRIYSQMLDRSHNGSTMPSPPGSPGYYFGAPTQMDTNGYCSPPDQNEISFINPFGTQTAHHPPQPHHQFHTLPRRGPLGKSMLGYDGIQSHPIPIRAVPSHAHPHRGGSQYLKKAGSLGRSTRMQGMGRNESKEVSFVNFTPHDATKILSGVAPSGSSKTKARREREAQEKRRKLSEAAAAAVIAAGGDPSSIPIDLI